MSKKSFFMGTFILTGTGILSRFIGFFYRIFLSHTLGAAGMGIFQLVIPLQSLIIAISAGGMQTAISKLTAFAMAKKDAKNASHYLFIGTFCSLFISILLSFILYTKADWTANQILKEPETLPLIQLLIFCIPPSTLHMCINGYYYAQKKTVLPSVIQLLEQFFRVFSTFIIYVYLLKHHLEATPKIAVWGSLISECFASAACIAAILFHLHKSNIFSFKINNLTEKIYDILHLSFPLTLNRLLPTLLSSIEVILIPQRLMCTGISNSQALSIYGILSGMALPLILFPSAFTNSAAVMLMPSVTELSVLGQRKRLIFVIRNIYKYIVCLGCIFTMIFYLFGNIAGNLLFHNTSAGIYIKTLAFICPFLYLNTTLSSVLHGLGKTGSCLFYNSISICIRILFVIYIIPLNGIRGYLHGMIFSEFIKTSLYTLSLCHINRRN